ncbi:putative outer membrane protein [Chryseobacterium sp. StRB126]|uniref:OmpH family outer membrane protein n=1 Tax=Chryseobacterium sp. StRB126 TaxID=878220 RepID=UPI0004E99A9E|nr:OmpH family outer membrane protein [Chryseobacterium sp. StRB126]BAP33163.1 putative outer membrane protein [Chryseobacterium sp. StRB126]
MKLIKLFFIAAGLTLTANTVNAQQKIGNINTDDIFSSLSEVKTAGEAIDNLTKAKQTEIDKIISEYQTKLKTAQEKEKTLTNANKDTVTKELVVAQTELDSLAKKIEEGRAQAAKEISAKQNDLFAPIQQKVKDAISIVSKEKGLNYVFDIAARGSNLIYTDGGEDITAQVKAKLGASATASKPAAVKAKK